MTRFITILSGKGGVGKTTIAINLAAALRRLGRDVILLDANLTTPDVGLYFGISNFPVTLNDFIKGESELNDAIYLHPRGFKVLPTGIDHNDLKYHDADFKKIFKKLQGLTEIVVIDGPTGLGKDVRDLLKHSDEILIVTNPDILSVTNALKTSKLAEEHDSTVLGVVLNNMNKSDYEMDVNSVEAMLSIPVISELDYDETITKARIERKPLIFNYPRDETSVNIKALATKLVN